MNQNATKSELREEGYKEAIKLLRECYTEDGILATPTEKDNYQRVWARDSCFIGLASLLTEDSELVEGLRLTLNTLIKYQGPHGEIPSNVDPRTDRVSYGGTAGRVDADLWFLIACGQYWQATGDDDFLDSVLEPIEKVRWLLGAWEFNARGLLYVPITGDWADEYVQNGYVLFDQLLYLQAHRELCGMHCHIHGSSDHALDDRTVRLKELIRSNYWFSDREGADGYVYHEVLYKKGREAAPRSTGYFWMPFFTPAGYGYRFDSLANALVSLLDVADDTQRELVDEHVEQSVVQKNVRVLPAFDPVITPKDEDWADLQMTFSHTFKNHPYEYHNGGLWPFVTSVYAADLAKRGKTELARAYVEGIHRANRSEIDGEEWGFPEFLHGKKHTPGGTKRLGWSAAAAVVGEHVLEGKAFLPAHPDCIC